MIDHRPMRMINIRLFDSLTILLPLTCRTVSYTHLISLISRRVRRASPNSKVSNSCRAQFIPLLHNAINIYIL